MDGPQRCAGHTIFHLPFSVLSGSDYPSMALRINCSNAS